MNIEVLHKGQELERDIRHYSDIVKSLEDKEKPVGEAVDRLIGFRYGCTEDMDDLRELLLFCFKKRLDKVQKEFDAL